MYDCGSFTKGGHMKKRVLSLMLVLALVITTILPVGQVQAATVKINKAKVTLEVTATIKLKISGTKTKATWTSSNKSIATVNASSDGLSVTVTAKKEGKTTITAKVGSKKYTSTVTVVDNNKTEATPTPKPTVKPTKTSWKEILKDYETWVDEYVAFMKKYMANPLDLTLLSKYSNMLTKYNEWTKKLDSVQGDLSSADLKEWTATYLRIVQKLSDIY
jgi:hypothetical protein